MNLTHQVVPRGEEIQDPLALDRVRNLGLVLDLTRLQRKTAMKLHQTMSPVTKSRVESCQLSKCIVALACLPGYQGCLAKNSQ